MSALAALPSQCLRALSIRTSEFAVNSKQIGFKSRSCGWVGGGTLEWRSQQQQATAEAAMMHRRGAMQCNANGREGGREDTLADLPRRGGARPTGINAQKHTHTHTAAGSMHSMRGRDVMGMGKRWLGGLVAGWGCSPQRDDLHLAAPTTTAAARPAHHDHARRWHGGCSSPCTDARCRRRYGADGGARDNRR